MMYRISWSTPARRLVLFGALMITMLSVPLSLQADQSLFWLQADGGTSRLGMVNNPQMTVPAEETKSLYLWLRKDSLNYGFDGVSIDIRLRSSDGGLASAVLNFDEPAGRWHGTSGGIPRSDSGGIGVDDANAIDLSNSDTLAGGSLRLGELQISGVVEGTVTVSLCVGRYGITDGGNNAVVWFGLQEGSTAPESMNISGGVSGFCSQVPEAVVEVTPPPIRYRGDFDGDQDVDQSDFAHLQTCLAGSELPQNDPDCADARLNEDWFVEQNDVDLFFACFSGPDIAPPTGCAE